MTKIKNHFPEDMTAEILSRLPVKSLMRFRCSCKFWFGLVRNPNFIEKHLRNYDYENTCLLIVNPGGGFEGGSSFHLYTDATLTDLSYQYIDPQVPSLKGIMGPYDGLFCLPSWENTITLWNPATKEFRTLPKCKTILPSGEEPLFFYSNFGFGFDQINNSYKMILIRTMFDDDYMDGPIDYECTTVSLYTMSSDSWRDFEVEELSHILLHKRFTSTCLDGVCYWLANKQDSDDNQVILSFNLADEAFKELPLPDLPKFSFSYLGLNDDVLSLLIFDTSDGLFVTWAMKEGCWLKESTIGPILNVREPLGFWKNGGFLIESDTKHLLLYDPNSPILKDLQIITYSIEIRFYKESLVSVGSVDV